VATKTPSSPAPKDSLTALASRAQNGDETALPALREFFERPGAVEAIGNLALMAQESLISKYCGKNLLIREGLTRKMEALRAELAGPDPTALERLLVERIVACWMRLYQLEAIYAGKDSMSLELGAYYERAITSAHKRYLSAIKTLATVRKMALPVLQVNIAKKQVNVVNPVTGPEGA
jgi:hypothetical protein